MNNNYVPYGIESESLDQAGPMSGIRRADDERMLRRSQELGLQGMLIGNQQSQANLDRYSQLTPHEVAQSAYRGSLDTARNTPGHIRSVLSGEEATNDITGMNRDLQKATQPSKIRATVGEQEIAALGHELMRVRAVAAQHGPLAAQAEYQQVVQKSGELGKRMPPHYTPESLEQTMQVLTDSPAHRRATQLQNSQNETAIKVGAGNNAATIAAAQARAAQRLRTLIQNFQMAKTPEQVLMYGEMILADDEVDDTTRRQVQAGMTAAARTLAEKGAKGAFDLNDPRKPTSRTAAEIAARLNPGQGQGQPGGQGGLPHIHTMDELKRLYPGKSDQWIRESYQRKFGTQPR